MKHETEVVDPQADQKKAPGREKQPEGSKRLQVMVSGVGHGIEVQPGSMASDVLAQVGMPGRGLYKAEVGGPAFKPGDKVFESVNDQAILYVR